VLVGVLLWWVVLLFFPLSGIDARYKSRFGLVK
jgi:hypothetical protein